MAEAARYRELLAAYPRGVIRTACEAGRLERVWRGVYAPPSTDELDRLRGLVLRLPEGTLFSHHTAAALYGFGAAAPDARIHVTLPRGANRPAIAGVCAHEAVLPVDAPTSVHGLACVPVSRCAVDLARSVSPMAGLAVLDGALTAGGCLTDDLDAEVAQHAGLRGVVQARRLVGLADVGAECPQESHLRFVLVSAGLPRPQVQCWVGDSPGTRRYRLDLGYPRRRVGVEYDGASHLDRDRLAYDRVRMNWLDEHGWTMRYFTATDVYRRPASVAAAVRQALTR